MDILKWIGSSYIDKIEKERKERGRKEEMAFDVFLIEIVRAVEGIFSVIDEIELKKREKGNEACFSLLLIQSGNGFFFFFSFVIQKMMTMALVRSNEEEMENVTHSPTKEKIVDLKEQNNNL